MNEGRLSPAAKDLLAMAKTDAPNAAARAKMWAGVSRVVGGGAAAAGAASGPASTPSLAVAGSAGAVKMLTLTAVLGGAVTVGIAATVLHVGAFFGAPAHASISTGDMAAPVPGRDGQNSHASIGMAANAEPVAARAGDVGPISSQAVAPAAAASGARPKLAAKLDPSEALAHEASLIAEARAALARGDALSALRKARAARSLPMRQLVPEELVVEAQALRSLGRESEATKVDRALRSQYPESALAR